jgi:prepilin-type N-terminal cleavage/methylation domain-containing protein
MNTATKIQYSVFSIQYLVSGPGVRTGVARYSARHASRGFSLIELLVVIGVISILAALTFPAMNAVKVAQARHRARAELTYIETAIEAYKTKLGFYPPDNGGYYLTNQLYFELLGTTLILDPSGKPFSFQTLDGSASILVTGFRAAFGSATTVTGFMNTSKPGAGDDVPNAVKFLTELKAAQFLAVNSPVNSTVLGVSMSGMPVFTGPNNGEIVPYGYNSSSPVHNPKSFDLWVDIIAGGKTNRISNWSTRPIFVSYTTSAKAYP